MQGLHQQTIQTTSILYGPKHGHFLQKKTFLNQNLRFAQIVRIARLCGYTQRLKNTYIET